MGLGGQPTRRIRDRRVRRPARRGAGRPGELPPDQDPRGLPRPRPADAELRRAADVLGGQNLVASRHHLRVYNSNGERRSDTFASRHNVPASASDQQTILIGDSGVRPPFGVTPTWSTPDFNVDLALRRRGLLGRGSHPTASPGATSPARCHRLSRRRCRESRLVRRDDQPARRCGVRSRPAARRCWRPATTPTTAPPTSPSSTPDPRNNASAVTEPTCAPPPPPPSR